MDFLFADCQRCGRIRKLPHSDTQARGPCSPALQLWGSVTQAGAARMGRFPRLQTVREQLHENSLRNFPSSVSQLGIGHVYKLFRIQLWWLMISCATLSRQTCFDGFCYYNKIGSSGHILNLFNPPKISTVVVFYNIKY